MHRAGVFVLILACLAAGGPSCGGKSAGQPARVLFLGNSYTFYNRMPETFAALAKAGGKTVEVGSVAKGGWSLADHDGAEATRNLIGEKAWSFVVLQEDSVSPSQPGQRSSFTLPAARRLAEAASSSGARVLLAMTWGRQRGFEEFGFSSFDAMQDALGDGTLELAGQIGAGVVPMGEAWRIALQKAPSAGLWSGDGSHPSPAGSYLCACVYYAAVFQTSPVGLDYLGNLDASLARSLQEAAAQAVLEDPAHWGLK